MATKLNFAIAAPDVPDRVVWTSWAAAIVYVMAALALFTWLVAAVVAAIP